MKPPITRRIIFCIDVTDEMNETMGPSIDGSIEQTLLLTTSRLETVQFLVKRYVAMNSMISPQDSYGIILLAEEATWYMDFTKDIGLISSAVDVLQTTSRGNKQFDADSLFNVIENHTDLVNPDIYTQVLVFYGRTENVPLCRTNIAKSICGYPQFVLDVLFIHGPVSGREENCQRVYDFWIETSKRGWFFEFARLGRSALTKTMAQLTAHPLQRGDQDKIAEPLHETIYLVDDE
ncbi:hypothetical protein O0I10_006528 [Lichtheimia ornata]|uniref:BRISC and BRCA1-A complex member 1 n=1 Tax=Lichtheimia ornata TaxID=688661 RepID=A0AAD7XYK1_9FUNG|nr:uncharacterized protein O0I10_006528 [Lichtheimia ornata]KAJ8657713.1 hypothetical protein O0I10_006528 [Lichtheimia ornata]